MKGKLLKYAGILLALVTLQTVTYLTLAHRQLKNKLLPDYFASLNHNSDSVLVRNYIIRKCGNDFTTYLSHDLKENEREIKQKLNVHYAWFDDLGTYTYNDTLEKQFSLVYTTWAQRPDWAFGFYSMTQTELLQIGKSHYYKREAKYYWVLFFWVQTFEFMESADLACSEIIRY